jgi:hypothetical protein
MSMSLDRMGSDKAGIPEIPGGFRRSSEVATLRISGYESYRRNPDGTYVCGGAYNGYKRNPDGTYVAGNRFV